MKMIKNTLLTFSLFLFSKLAFAALPSYAQSGDVSSQLEEKGLLITSHCWRVLLASWLLQVQRFILVVVMRIKVSSF